MKKIKDFIVHMLGGHSQEEYRRHAQEAYDKGVKDSYMNTKQFADALYGYTADEWCRNLYEYLTKKSEQ
jgi:hypothetical protein